jgi:hypothetical protein
MTRTTGRINRAACATTGNISANLLVWQNSSIPVGIPVIQTCSESNVDFRRRRKLLREKSVTSHWPPVLFWTIVCWWAFDQNPKPQMPVCVSGKMEKRFG